MKNLKCIPLLLLVLGLIGTSCNKEEEMPGTVVLLLDHEVAGEELILDDIRYVCEAGHPYSVIRMKYYLSDIVLQDEEGKEVEGPLVHYREVGWEDTREITISQVPAGTYTSLNFIYGLDETLNVDGGLENTLTNINMEWPLPGDQGYHYMKFEGKYDSLGAGVIKSFNLHTGATGGNQNYVSMSLPLDLQVNGNTWTIRLRMDLNEWLQHPNTYDFEEFGPMIMANQQAQEKLKANAVTIFEIESVSKE